MAALDDRSLGWLRYLYRKATTPDDWDKHGRPHPHWDEATGEPMTSWHRLQLRSGSHEQQNTGVGRSLQSYSRRSDGPSHKLVVCLRLDDLASSATIRIGHYPDRYRPLVPPEHGMLFYK